MLYIVVRWHHPSTYLFNSRWSSDCSLEAFSYSSSLLYPAPSSCSGLGPPPPPPPPPPVAPGPVPPPDTPPEQVACLLLLLSPGPEQHPPIPPPQPTPPDSSARPPDTHAIPVASRANRRPGAHRRRRGLLRPGAGFSAPVVSGRWRRRLDMTREAGEARGLAPVRTPWECWCWCGSDPVRRSVSSGWSDTPTDELGFFFGRIVMTVQGGRGVRFNDSERVWTFKLERLLSRNTR